MLPIAMTERETALLDALLEASTDYLEFGAGGSTCRAFQRVKRRIICADSSAKWLADVEKATSEITAGHQPKLVLSLADLGPTGDWGAPTDDESKEKWPSYSLNVWSIDGAEQSDLFLIDGRFRVACFAETFVRARIGSLVMIHDFESRPRYHVVFDFARRVAVAEELSVFVKDERSDVLMAARVAEKYRTVSY